MAGHAVLRDRHERVHRTGWRVCGRTSGDGIVGGWNRPQKIRAAALELPGVDARRVAAHRPLRERLVLRRQQQRCVRHNRLCSADAVRYRGWLLIFCPTCGWFESECCSVSWLAAASVSRLWFESVQKPIQVNGRLSGIGSSQLN